MEFFLVNIAQVPLKMGETYRENNRECRSETEESQVFGCVLVLHQFVELLFFKSSYISQPAVYVGKFPFLLDLPNKCTHTRNVTLTDVKG